MDLIRPDDPQYDDARTVFNSMIDKRPAVIAQCASPADVIAALELAQDKSYEVAVRAGGHSVAGMCLNDDGIVIDVRPMKEHRGRRRRASTVRVGAGVTWGEFDRATQEHGLATTGGRVSTTGVAGLTLGGGSGWLERKYGLACDNLVVGRPRDRRRAARSPRARPRTPTCSGRCTAAAATSGWRRRSTFRLHPVGPDGARRSHAVAGRRRRTTSRGATATSRTTRPTSSAPALVDPHRPARGVRARAPPGDDRASRSPACGPATSTRGPKRCARSATWRPRSTSSARCRTPTSSA